MVSFHSNYQTSEVKIMAEILPEIETFARIKVVGIGGGGGNALNRMVQSKLRGIDFVAINTDAQALHWSQANNKVHIGKEATRGLGAGADPDVGRQAAEESEEDIYNALKHSEMVFITAGYGGGTGSGAAPIVAKIARDIGALTVAIITKPFGFEGERRRKIAEAGIAELKDKVDTLIIIPNDRILQLVDRKTPLVDAFGTVDDVLKQGVQGIADLITINGLVNLDFADVKSIMSNAGSALMGIGEGTGDTRAIDAVKYAMDSPLLEVSIQGAKGVLINFTGGRDMGMHEIEEAAKLIHDSVDPDANIIWGTVLDENLTGAIRVTLVATGFDGERNHKGSLNNDARTEHSSIYMSTADTMDTEDTPFLKPKDAQPIFDDIEDHTPLVTATPEILDDFNVEPSLDTDNQPATEKPSELDEFEFDESIYDAESTNNGFTDEPIIDTMPTDFDKEEPRYIPAYERFGIKIGRTKSKNDDDIPSIVKKKL